MEDAAVIIFRLGLRDLYLKYIIDERPIGSGSFGAVYSARNKITQELVAIKIIKEFPSDSVDRKRLFREIKILHMLKGSANTINLKDIISSTVNGNITGLALIFERYQTNLDRIIRSKQRLTVAHIQRVLYQILTGLFYIHSANLVHRDLKPANILVNSDCSISISDFGLARATQRVIDAARTDSGPRPPKLYRRLTNYVVTRWYRCPELAVRNSDAGEAPSDMWSVGCILAELLLRQPLFQESCCNKHLIRLALDILGTPKHEDECEWIESEASRSFVKQYPNKTSQIDILFRGMDSTAVDLLKKLLQIDPSQRITAEEALRHPFFNAYHNLVMSNLERFSIASMSPDEQRDLNDYYLLETVSEGAVDSAALNQEIENLIKKEIARYTPVPAVAAVSSSLTDVIGTIFHFKDPDKRTTSLPKVVDSKSIEESDMKNKFG